jgi:hypothetical protein
MGQVRCKASPAPPLLAIRFESLVESDDALRRMPVERQSEEDFLWYTLMHKPGHALEPKFPVVIRMPHQAASLSIQAFET